MEDQHLEKIARELNLNPRSVAATVTLLAEGATLPFITRYRKEMTGSLDEVEIAAIRDRHEQLLELTKRREAVLKSLTEQAKLTPELEGAVLAAETLAVLEDLYLPYRPKRRTRATIAREKGLEPLALRLLAQENFDPEKAALEWISEERGVASAEEALAGARDIVAEALNENAEVRAGLRELFWKRGTFSCRVVPGKEDEAAKYKDYFAWNEPVATAPSHRILAMRRGEKEGFLLLETGPLEEEALELIEGKVISTRNATTPHLQGAAKDGYRRLLKPSLETEIRLLAKQKADTEAIRVFADNLRGLLLASPLGQKTVLALDPGFRTGCKLAVLDRQGQLLHYTAIFPHEPQRQTAQAGATVRELVEKYNVEAIAIGNGTAGRESETFIRSLKLPASLVIVMVNESGASVYSASEIARQEFPDHDVTVRGAVSIGRRLVDPLAELVKIDPKAIGVGQYQHDVDQSALKAGLDDVVISCVNAVGVEVNTASKELLTYVSGLGPQLAANVVAYRSQHGPFRSRRDLRAVPRLGEKAYEQAAGFLRIHDAVNPLDRSAVHPESYPLVERMATDLGCTVTELMGKEELRRRLDLKKYLSDTVGLPTLNDIVQELAKPGRDPRQRFEAFAFAEGIHKMEDLRPGMKLPGIVTNVTAFGAFVDIGVHQDGLIHISHLSDRYVANPADVVKVQQPVEVTVLEVDIPRKRIALSLKGQAPVAKAAAAKRQEKAEAEESMETKLAKLKNLFK